MKLPLSWDIPIIIALLSFTTFLVSLVSLQESCTNRDQDIKIAVAQTVSARHHPTAVPRD